MNDSCVNSVYSNSENEEDEELQHNSIHPDPGSDDEEGPRNYIDSDPDYEEEEEEEAHCPEQAEADGNITDLDLDVEDNKEPAEQEARNTAASTANYDGMEGDDADSQDAVPQQQGGLWTADAITNYALEGEDMLQAGKRLFPLNSKWATKQDLKTVLNNYGLTFGFKVVVAGWSFTCNKAGFTKDQKKGTIISEDRK
jgi:hypothetical protein